MKALREAKAAKDAAPPPPPEMLDEQVPVEEPEAVDAPLELSDAEVAKIRAEAMKKVEAELVEVNRLKKKELMAKMLDQEIQHQRREAGLTDYRDDMLDILIDVAPFTDRITIDGTVYFHEHWYKVDRRLFDVLREIMARSWDSEDRAGNPNRKFRRTVAGSMNPLANERMMLDGSFTIGLPTTVNGRTGAASAVPGVGA